ncbi:MAG TPA: amino acid adenylation domain-containing protein, partial [Tahibacter sp.]|uniref:non-ribosomal peptide synthetase n=1 Tax=Tahibacter sp. TaxID=2056211 RepID=UPI002C6A14C1
MSALDLLRRLNDSDVRLSVQDGRLRVNAGRGVLDEPLLAELRAHRDALIALLAADGESPPSFPRIARTPAMPCAPAQRPLWLQQQLAGATAAYNLPVALRLRGALDVAALRESLAAIVQRHESLRTTFVAVDGEPCQRIADRHDVALPVDDVDPASLAAHLAAQGSRVFDLANGPLFEARLLRLAADEHVLLLDMHHLVSDGWSLGVLMSELGQGYAARRDGRAIAAAPLALQYADYAAWQHARSGGPEQTALVGYWRRALDGAPGLLALPCDRLRPARQSLRGAAEPLAVPADLVRRLSELARRENASLYMLLLAAFQLLLARLSAQDDIVVGTPVANRPHAALETLIGYFVNTVPLRIRIDAQTPFRALLGSVRDTALAAFAHQELPYDQIVEAANPARSTAHAPLFQVMFALQNAPAELPPLPGIDASLVAAPRRHAKFDLSLSLEQTEAGLAGELDYATDLFDAATIRAWLGDYGTLLDDIAARPDAAVADLGHGDADERARRVARSCGEPVASDPYEFAPLAVARQARERPHAPAVDAPDARLDYATLAARAGRLAEQLRARGIGAESRVGICLPRSADFAVAALAVWNAGAAFVALDTHYPPARLRYVAADADLAGVLVNAATQTLGESLQRPLLRVDELCQLSELPAAVPEPRLHPVQLAYIVYTSGSTGEPKGAMVGHGALHNMLLWYRGMTGIAASDRSSLLAQLGFDGSLMDIWGCLTAGACLCIPDEAARERPPRLAAWLQSQRISIAYVPTPLAEALLAPGIETPTHLRQLLTGGEQLKRRAPADAGFVLQNAYGPSEAAVVTLAGAVAPAPAPITIGRPIANTRAYVLDAKLRPVADGVAGELFLAGPSVGRGYCGRAALTAERFLPDPFAVDAGARMYRTGDRVRRLASGDYEFLGRVDRQIKLRGFRIEPGEIEAALCRIDGVRAAAVELRETPNGDAALVAYVVAASGDVRTDALRDALRRTLPPFQLPSAWVRLDALPLAPGGKVDRRALPPPVWTADERPNVAPRDALERDIAALYAEVLGVDRVGAHDDFFALGGHSLAAMRLLARVQAQFGVELPLSAIFEAPGVAALADMLRPLRAGGAPADTIPAVARDAALPLSFAQQRLWFLAQLEPGSTAYHMPLVVRLRGALDTAALTAAFDVVAQRHESLRTRFVERDGVAMQCFDRPLAPLAADAIAANALDATVAAFLAQPFDLHTDALLRARLLRIDDGSHVLAVVVHHIIADGASIALFARELAQAYRARATGSAPALPPLPLHYGDYAAWQHARAGDAAAHDQLAWWTHQLADAPAALDLPLDRPRRDAAPAVAAVITRSLDAVLVVRLRALAQQHGATVFMTLLAAFKLQLARLSGQADVCVGTPMSERRRAGLEHVFGLFLGTLALRTRLPDDATFAGLLAQVRRTALDAYAHQDVPFERIVDALRIERDLSRHPLFQVFFNMPGRDAALSLPGIAIETVAVPPQPAKFDLTLYAYEHDARIDLQLHYDARLFDAARAEDLLDQLCGLLAQVVADPRQRVAAYSLRTARAARVLPDPALPLARGWNGSLAERFRAAALAHPERCAVSDARRQFTYRELDRASDRVGALLRSRGVGVGDVVALHATRCGELAVALLAVIKCGAAFMILDAAYPDARLLACVEAAPPVAWIAVGGAQVRDAQLAAALAGLRWRGTLADAERDTADWSDAALPLPGIDADSLSHIAFTSGSTGRPKAVAGRHGPFTQFLPWLQQRFGLTAEDRYSVLSGLSHDPLQRDLLLPLTTGATACVPDAEQLAPGELARWMRAQRITVANLTPAMAGIVADSGASDAVLPDLRRAFVVGDAFPRADAQHFAQRCPHCEIVSFYGATETQWALGHQVADTSPEAPATVPLGRGFPGVQLLLLNAADQPAGIGEVAEVCIRSAHIARGYLDAAGGGAARFGANPVTGDAQDRIYRTGDLGRYAPDGSVHGLGRADRQVSLRGVRIEPGDVEAALRRLPAVRQASVLHVPGASDAGTASNARLAGFVVTDDGAIPSDWRATLRQWLPDALIPSTLTALGRLPLTPNGKLDRAALLATERAQAAAQTARVAPSTPTEHRIAAIFGAVLGIEAIDADADFFAIGGSSLSAMRVIARLREFAGRAVPLRQLFDTTSVAALARWLDANAGIDDAQDVDTALPATPATDDAPLSPAQQRLWFLQQLDRDSAAYNMLLAVRLTGRLDIVALQAAFADLQARHESLRTVFREQDGRVRQHVLPAPDTFALARERSDADAFAARLQAFAAQPFDLAEPPLRACLYALAPDEHALALSLHHIVSDGWSMGVLVRELAACYAARRAGHRATLPPVACRYVDYSRRLHDRRRPDDRESAFWRDHLRDQPPLLPLPTDRPRPAQQRLWFLQQLD